MDNHYHLLIETLDGNLSIGMRQLGGVYTQKFNRLHNRVGHLFQGRYGSVLVDKEGYLLELCRYIVLNPVRAKMVTHPVDYPWSSYPATAGTVGIPQFLSISWILAQFGNDPASAQRQYRDFVLAGIGEESPWEQLQSPCFLGSEQFISSLVPHLDQRRREREIPRRARFADRPPLSDLLQPGQSLAERNRAMARAHLQHGYFQQEIAGQTRLH